ncbi:MAG: rod shape-determining protein [Clostridia bacterium]|nr:rod shape-determining protein [Clostridia bacterium]
MIFSRDLGIDLGTSNTYVWSKGKGVILSEPSVVAVDAGAQSHTVLAVGASAKAMIGRTPGSIVAVKPLANGVISDYELTASLLSSYIRKATGSAMFGRIRVMLGVPSGVTEVERRAVHDAAANAGARYVSVIDVPMAAAIGAGLPVNKARGNMVVDLGGGTSEVAVVSVGDIVASACVRVGGDDLDEAISAYIRRTRNMLIGKRTAEDIKLKIGSAAPYDGEGTLAVRGRSLTDGLPADTQLTSAEAREAMQPVIKTITDMIADALERTPPELISDIFNSGITLTGGGARLRGIADVLRGMTKMPVNVAEKPELCVIKGIGYCLEKQS